jgi:DNA-binding GntR family transcriptional regulator
MPWMKARIAHVLASENRLFDLKELSQNLKAKKEEVMTGLQEMVKEGVISRIHKEGLAQYIIQN